MLSLACQSPVGTLYRIQWHLMHTTFQLWRLQQARAPRYRWLSVARWRWLLTGRVGHTVRRARWDRVERTGSGRAGGGVAAAAGNLKGTSSTYDELLSQPLKKGSRRVAPVFLVEQVRPVPCPTSLCATLNLHPPLFTREITCQHRPLSPV